MQLWHSIWGRAFQLTEYKFFEVQLMWDARHWLAFELDFWTWSGQDHAGPSLNIAVLGLELGLSIYDARHWDDETNTWAVYDYIIADEVPNKFTWGPDDLEHHG